MSREQREGRVLWVKRRRKGSGFVIACANAFFRLAHNPVAVWRDPAAWQSWEIDCFEMLNGDGFHAFAEGSDTVCADQIPGESLCRLLDAGALSVPMMITAGKELRRAHAERSEYFSGSWSHGDPHLGNFIFDSESGRCRMIDFEVAHDRGLEDEERHADDLLVPLLDLSGRTGPEQWRSLAQAFVEGYARPEVAQRLRQRLRVPSGIPRFWWAIRTGYVSRTHLENRLEALRDVLEKLTR